MSFLVSVVAVLSAFSHHVTGVPLMNFYSFGSTAGDTALPPDDDGSSGPITLSMPYPFFDENRAMVFVNNNGVLSFETAVSTFTPESFPLSEDFIGDYGDYGTGSGVTGNIGLIAPYWADVDTRGTGTVWYRETTDLLLLARAASDIQAAFISQGSFAPTYLFIATWDRVGYFNQQTNLTNTFQCVMATNGVNSFVIFLYADGEIQWTTGSASGGIGGLGGTPAQVGFNAGDGIRFASVPGSQTAEIINITTTSNVGTPGVWIFRVDEEDIAVGGCSFEPSVTLEIAPRSGHVLGGTAVLITGPCLEESDNITCVFDGIEVEGLFVSMMLALCVSPPLTEIGRRPLQLIVQNATDGNIRSQGSTEFVSLPFDVGFTVQLSESDLLFTPGATFTVTWSPNSIVPSVDPDSFTVDVGLYCFDEASDTFTAVAVLASDIANSGETIVTLPSQISGFSDVCIFSIEVMVGGTTNTLNRRQVDPDLVNRLIELAQLGRRAGVWGIVGYLTFSLFLRGLCEAWCATQPANIGQTSINQVLPCPPTVQRAMVDNRFEMENMLISRTFHPGTDRCFRQIVMNRQGECSPGSQCCYDFNGRLIIGPPNGGTIDRASPQGRLRCYLEHFVVDVLPSIYCCVGIFADCGSYYQKRPSRDETGYRLPVPACVYGDPHLVTLDGLKYTFNGRGEFVLVETADNSFTLQGRMVDAVDASGNSVAATVFSAVVCRQDDSDTVQFEVSRRGIDVKLNGVFVDFQTLPQQVEFTNVILTVMGNNTVSAQFSSGAFIEVTEELEIISQLFFSLPDTFQGVTRGLLGNFNGDTSDDLLPRSSNTPVPTDSSLLDIHLDFGVTWIINNSTDSLFTYATGENFTTFFDPAFNPEFQPTFSDPGLEAQASDICGDDAFCLFDIAATGRTDIGLATVVGSQTFDDIVALSTAITCDPPCVNGACVANDTCNCAAGFIGDTCDEAVIEECTQEQDMCENGGICRFQAGSFFCDCPPGFSGTLCENAFGLDLSFAGDSPRLGIGTVIAELFTNRPGAQIICFLRRTTFTQDCSNGSVTFTNVPAGGYFLQVVATDRVTGNTAEIRTRVFVPESDEFCSVNAINQLVSVSGNSASAEFRSTGNPIDFRCRVDRQPYFPCTSPVTIAGLDSGRHRLRVRPRGCGRPRSGHKSLSARFDV